MLETPGRILDGYRPCDVDRIWVWVFCNKIPIYPIFYRLKGDRRFLNWKGLDIWEDLNPKP